MTYGVEFEPWRTCGARWILVNGHGVFFVADDCEAVVSIIRIIYGGRDAKAVLDRISGQPSE